jgi:tetratricopeptide (TPR) repeat protein
MLRVVCTALIAILLCLAPVEAAAETADSAVNRPVRDKWALVVGIGNFQNSAVPKLKYAAKDARDFRNYLVNEANFSADHVRLLVDDAATQRRVLSELGTKFLARVAKPDDVVVLFFSTHGSPSQADIRGKNFLVAYDSDPEDLYTTGIEMDKIVESVKSRILSDRVLLVMDACHSGAVTHGAKGLARTGNFDAEQIAQGSGQLVICSSEPDEQSWESKRYHNGVFTKNLLDGLRLHGSKTTLGTAFPRIQKNVSAEVQEDYAARQKPKLTSKWNGNELMLAVRAAEPQAVPKSVREILEPDSTYPRIASAISAIKVPIPVARPPASAPAARSSMSSLAPKKSEYDLGVQLYDRGDYGSAVKHLSTAVLGGYGNDAYAHYYLANALMKTNRLKEALREYGESYRLKPTGNTGAYCAKILQTYSGASAMRPSGSSRASAPAPAAVESLSAGAPDDPHLLKSIALVRSSLPRIAALHRQGPTLVEIISWSLQEQAHFVNDAIARRDTALQNLTDAQETLKRVQSQVHSILPSSREYGEADANFKKRVAMAEARIRELVAPYQSEVETRNRILSDENSIVQTCTNALQKIQGYGK